jgi:hypothetical protein
MPLVNKVAFAAWALVATCFAVWALEMYEPDFSADYRAAAAQDRHPKFRVNDVSCVSIDRGSIIVDQKAYADPALANAVTDLLSIKTVLDADVATCPWNFSINVISGRNYNVTYGGEFARYLVSIDICERKSAVLANPKCLSKNIYVFNRNIEPHKLFLLALLGLARPQAEEWEVYKVKKEQL